MRLESISASPDRAGRYLVTFSDGKTMKLYPQTVSDCGLFPGQELSQEAYAALLDAAGGFAARMRAVRIVSASSVSKRDLEQRLIRKGEDPGHARDAVAWMEELSLVDDRETARQIVARGIARGYGPARVKQMLYEKQIPKALWEEALADFPDQEEEIMSFLRGRLAPGADQKERKKAIDALLRRGHSWSAIRRCLDRLGQAEYADVEDY